MLSLPPDGVMLLQKRLRKGEVSALDETYRLYFDKVYGTALHLVKRDFLATDIVQDVFLKLWSNRHNISYELPVDQQLYVITRNVVYDFFRKRIREEKALLALTLEDWDPERNSASTAQVARLQELLHDLPERQRQVVTMLRFRGMTYEEVAEELGISPNTVSNHYAAALNYLRKRASDLSE